MLPDKVPWNLKDVVLVHFLRLLAGILLVRYIFPLLFAVPPALVELTDRVIVISLVWYAVRKYNNGLTDWGLSSRKVLRSVLWGLAAGGALLVGSMYTGRLYASLLFLEPVPHPLVAQVENAVYWRQLLIPALLAGVAAPVAEEILYRLLTFLPLKDRLGLWGGAFVSSLVFAVFHFNLYWLAEMIVVGIGLAVLYYWTGSLISSIVAHSFINVAKIVLLFLNLPVY